MPIVIFFWCLQTCKQFVEEELHRGRFVALCIVSSAYFRLVSNVGESLMLAFAMISICRHEHKYTSSGLVYEGTTKFHTLS